MSNGNGAGMRMEPGRSRFRAVLLDAVAIVLMLGASVGAVLIGWSNGKEHAATMMQILTLVALVIGALALAALLMGLADGLRRLDLVERAVRGSSSSAGAAPHSLGSGDVNLAQLANVMREVRDISLLTPEQRATRLEQQCRDYVNELKQIVPAYLREHKWHEARRCIQEARERFPGQAEWEQLSFELEQARSAIEKRDIEAAERHVEELSKLGAWDRVEDVVRDLGQRYPGSNAALEFGRRMHLQRERHEADQRARFMAQAQDATHRREWNEALSAANAVIRRFPNSHEADALRQQLPTLTANAEIQTRQRMEARIRELIQQHDYEEALDISHEVLERYPNSPQATALRELIPEIENKLNLMQAAR